MTIKCRVNCNEDKIDTPAPVLTENGSRFNINLVLIKNLNVLNLEQWHAHKKHVENFEPKKALRLFSTIEMRKTDSKKNLSDLFVTKCVG